MVAEPRVGIDNYESTGSESADRLSNEGSATEVAKNRDGSKQFKNTDAGTPGHATDNVHMDTDLGKS